MGITKAAKRDDRQTAGGVNPPNPPFAKGGAISPFIAMGAISAHFAKEGYLFVLHKGDFYSWLVVLDVWQPM